MECSGLSCLSSRLKNTAPAKPEFIQFSNDALAARQVGRAHQHKVAASRAACWRYAVPCGYYAGLVAGKENLWRPGITRLLADECRHFAIVAVAQRQHCIGLLCDAVEVLQSSRNRAVCMSSGWFNNSFNWPSTLSSSRFSAFDAGAKCDSYLGRSSPWRLLLPPPAVVRSGRA